MSIASISKEEAARKAANAALETTKMIDAAPATAPAAVKKLIDKGGDANKITMAEMSAIGIAFKHFKGTA